MLCNDINLNKWGLFLEPPAEEYEHASFTSSDSSEDSPATDTANHNDDLMVPDDDDSNCVTSQKEVCHVEVVNSAKKQYI